VSEKMGIKLFTENDTPYGKSLQQWSNRWWNWMVGQPKTTNPTEDDKGIYANNCQTYEDVYFLCGTTTTKSVTRECTVPDGKSILLPVICFEYSLLEDMTAKNPHDLLRLATDDLKKYDKISARINGKEYTPGNGIIRIRSSHFTITLPKDNVWNTGDGFTFSAADGYWIFIRDLDPESYDIKVQAQPSQSDKDSLKIDTTYNIKVGNH
jgi:hypothetical protein